MPTRSIRSRAMRLSRWAAVSAIALATAWPRPAEAAPWLKLDRVEAEPTWVSGIARLRVFVSAVTLNGGTIPVAGKKEWVLQVGSAKKKIPYIAGHFKAVEDDLAVMLVVQTSSDYQEALPKIRDAAKEFVEALPSSASVGVISFSEDVQGDRRVGGKNRALAEIDALDADSVPTENALISAMNRAVRAFRRAKPSEKGKPMRKLVVVVSDGRDIEFEASRYRKIARRADREDIRIHAIAFSPVNQRKYMVGLGELTKRTQGTFRLVRDQKFFETQFKQLRDELEQQYVLTFYLPPEDFVGKRIKVLAKDMVSNELRIKEVTCGGETCGDDQFCAGYTCVDRPSSGGRGILGWILLIVGGLVGLLVLLMVVGYLLGRRERKRAAREALAAAAAEAAAAQDAHRIVPQGPQGGVVQPPAGARAPAAAAPAAHAAAAPAQAPARGRVQPAAPGAHAAPAGQAAAPTLLILSGPMQGQRLALRHGFTIGKAPNCDLVLTDDQFASSHHAQILMDTAGGCTLVDKQSTNGTFVNGVRENEKRLVSGMSIRVGSTEMRFL